MQDEMARLEKENDQLWDTLRAIAVKGLGLPDPWAEDAPEETPPEWHGLLSEKVAELRKELLLCQRFEKTGSRLPDYGKEQKP